MSLNSNAIIDVDDYKQLINIDDSDSDKDERYEEFINAASQEFERYCRRKFRQPDAAITETIDGNGRSRMRLRQWPITTPPTEIKYYNSGTETYIALTNPVFQVNADSGIITFMDGNRWIKGERNWQVSYIYGYTKGNMPSDLKMACAEQAKYKQRIFDDNLQGISSVGFDGGTLSYSHTDKDQLFPATVMTVLARYRSHRRPIRG